MLPKLEVRIERTAEGACIVVLVGNVVVEKDVVDAQAEALLAARKPLYAKTAHLKVDTAGLDCGELATGILESARYFFTGHL